ncbi:MAG: sulfatase-like hydrolase/transferase [Natronomonas sp.]|uniref:sulfatase-like hydrolase/transferase n=1 Tax=Natronomonas sp. TaxID=2184060 RepID=UPI0028702C5B|nr:sulfatase-like hydrolase/transferase [Natronomonas sp.]MDR9431937.1 sulfatase-like hydrolase/transferase [Natronomonas sp.]
MSSEDEQPNILFVCTDQERYDLTAPDGRSVDTPASDRLAREGLRCTRAYTPTAICSPARASILTGLYPHNHGLLSNPTRRNLPTGLPDATPTFGHRLSDVGYRTSLTGKWHIEGTTPEEAGFERLTGWDHSRDQTLDTEDYREFVRDQGIDPTAVTVEEDGAPGYAGVTSLPPKATQTAYLVDRTIERLERYAASGDRFCHRLDFPGPHLPYVVPASYAERYDPDDIDPWPSFAETFDGKPAIHEIHPEYYGCEGLDWDDWAPAVARYFAFQSLIEDQLDWLLTAMDELGLTENTLVVRTADHGDFAGAHRQLDKGPMMYEDIYRVPLFVRWPGVVEPGRTEDSFVELQDLMPTFCDVAGTDVPDTDGRSLVAMFEGKCHRDAAFAEYHGEPETLYTQRMVRTERFKFVFNGPDRNELYDLREDPHELINIADHPEYEDERRSLARRLGKWMQATDDNVSVERYRRRCC